MARVFFCETLGNFLNEVFLKDIFGYTGKPSRTAKVGI